MTTNIAAVADALLASRASGELIPTQPFLAHLNSADDAYAVQDLVAGALGWHEGGVGRHWKSGGAKRDALITHAALPPWGVWASPATAGDWPLHLHGVEAEIALRLGCAVTPEMAQQADQAAAQAWVESMTVAIEVIHTRWDQGYDTPVWLKLADLQSHGALVLSEWRNWRDLDWAQQGMQITINGVEVERRQGSHPLEHPTWGLAEFARHATRKGQTVAAGTVITTGSWNGIYRAKSGDHVLVNFDGVGQASVQF